MATRKIYDLAVVTGSYQGADGKPKNKYQNIGAILEKDDGGKFIMIERWFNPAGCPNPDNRSTVLLSMFEPRDNQQQAQTGNQRTPPGGQAQAAQQAPASGANFDDFEDDIPFN